MSEATREKRRLFEQEALPHLDALFSAAMYLMRNEEEANDLCQETLLRAYRFFDNFTPGTNCRAWLLAILRNLSRTWHSRVMLDRPSSTVEEFDRAVETASFRGSDVGNDPESLMLRRSAGQSIKEAVDELPEEFKAAIVLVDVESLSYEDAARALGVPIGTVRSRISRGRALIRKALEGARVMKKVSGERSKV